MSFAAFRFLAVCVAAACAPCTWPAAGKASNDPHPPVDRSPVDLVLGPGEDWIATANQTSGTVSLVRVADGQLLDEVSVGLRPTGIALVPSKAAAAVIGRRDEPQRADGEASVSDLSALVISCSYAGELVVVAVESGRLSVSARIPVPGEPHGVAVDASNPRAYVALAAADQVAVVDLVARRVAARIDVGRWPRFLACSADGQRLAVGVSGDRGVAVVDPLSAAKLRLEQFSGLNIGQIHVSSDGRYAWFPWIVYRRNPITTSNIQRGWVLASRVARVRLDEPARREVFSLDPQGAAVADPHGLALTPDERQLLVTASGTQELLVFRAGDLPFQDRGDTDHIDPRLLADRERFARIPLGGRPLAVRVSADSRTAYVANYLGNSVQVVDIAERRLTRTIVLGGPDEPSLARRGEAIFYDGRRSLDQWYSCHSCHYEGGTNAVVMDTTNDGSSFTFKTVLPLYSLPATAPWTWHGWQQDLRQAMTKSLTETMLGPNPSDGDVDSLIAYFRSLQPPPAGGPPQDARAEAAWASGRSVFHSERAGCANCHHGDFLSDGEVHDVGSGSTSDRYAGYNTPSLLGVSRRVLLMHDGRARSLEELLTGPHAPDQVTGLGALTDDERQDLIAYLRSL